MTVTHVVRFKATEILAGDAEAEGSKDPIAVAGPPGPGSGAPIFATVERGAGRSLVTFREAALWSLLAHAVTLIAILLAPRGTFSARPLLLSAEDQPVHMTFVEDRPRPPEPNPEAEAGSDRDRRRAQEETPENPSRMEPYSRGNTPAPIAQDPRETSEQRRPLTPEPNPPSPPGSERARAAADEAKAAGEIDARQGTGPFFVPPRGAQSGGSGGESLREKGERLKQALSAMGAAGAGAGGSAFRYDNPVGGVATPTGGLSFDTKGFDWGPYARRIYWIIWSNWHARMPPAVYAGLKGIVTIHFVIHRDGRITGIEILDSSDIPAYDNAAVLALEASSPLPPLPDTFPNDSDGVTGRFLYNIWGEDE